MTLYGRGGVGLLLADVLVLWLTDCMTEWGEGRGVSVYTFLCPNLISGVVVNLPPRLTVQEFRTCVM